ncbi:MarR family transcriptional regulator, partial [Streptomyces pharetrae CZA14]
WKCVMRGLAPAERATVITALHAYEAALEQAGCQHRNAQPC